MSAGKIRLRSQFEDVAVVPKLPWALLVYIVADDKRGPHFRAAGQVLDKAAQGEITAIAGAADVTRVHVALQVDYTNKRGAYRARLSSRRPKDFEPFEPRTHKFWSQVAGAVSHTELQTFRAGELNSADAATLRDFLAWGRAACPADHYAVQFWGHSNGPSGIFFDGTPGKRDSGRLLGLAALREALQATGPWALALFRDCFVSTLETAYELQGVVGYTLASQSTVPIAGHWPYVPLLAALETGCAAAEAAGVLAANLTHYHASQDNRGPYADVPFTLLDLSVLQTVTRPLNALVEGIDGARSDAMRSRRLRRALESARIGQPDNHTRPGDPALVDLFTLCASLRRVDTDRLGQRAIALIDAIWGPEFTGDEAIARTDKLVRWHGSSSRAFHGISAYYRPTTRRQTEASAVAWYEDSKSYQELALCAGTGWDRIALQPIET